MSRAAGSGGIQAARGELQLVKLQLERTNAIMANSIKYQIPADLAGDIYDIALSEGIVLHSFDGKTPFSPETLRKIRELKKVYDLDLDASASHRMEEKS